MKAIHDLDESTHICSCGAEYVARGFDPGVWTFRAAHKPHDTSPDGNVTTRDGRRATYLDPDSVTGDLCDDCKRTNCNVPGSEECKKASK